jgi:hypothetical protein
VATDDDAVLPSREDRLNEPEPAQAAGEGLEFVVADPAWVRRVGPKLVDGDVGNSNR